MDNAGDRPPRYGKIETGRSLLPEGIGPTAGVREHLLPNGSGAGAPALQGGCALTAKRTARDRFSHRPTGRDGVFFLTLATDG